MRYKPFKTESRGPIRGDVCLFKGAGEDRYIIYPAAVVSVTGSRLTVKRLWDCDSFGTRHLISDVAPTGLEYAAFLDPGKGTTEMKQLVRILGRLSKRDLAYLR